MTSSSSLVGRTLGNYKIVELLGQGGMATVYLGHQATVDRKVAIKVLPPHPGLDGQFIERFQLEARTIARLQHPHILPIYDYGTENDILYLVMAYINGGSVENLVEDGPVAVTVTNKILREIADAVDYAHRQGIVHRDIKPGNILMDSEGHALLADFGIAKLMESSANMTGTGVVGTPAYMSPEQAQGMPLDGRSDVYSLGVVVYQMLTGTVPFDAPSLMQIMLKVMQEPAPDLQTVAPWLPAELAEVMAIVLAKEPEDRYGTAREFADAFSAALGNVVAEKQPTVARSRPAPQPGATQVLPPTKAGKIAPETQTVIVQQGINPLVVLGGFALIAVALVVAVLLIVNQSGDDETNGFDPDITNLPTLSQAQIAVRATAAMRAATAVAVAALPSFGSVSYSTSDELGDSLSMRVNDFPPPANGQVYIAWLVNTRDDVRINLGQIIVDARGEGALTYTDEEGRLLAAHFNAVSITQEANSSVTEPTSPSLFSGSVPIEVVDAINEIYVGSMEGLNANPPDEPGRSLLDGAITEARVARQHSGYAAAARSLGGMRNHAEHTINILRGEEVDYDGNGNGENPGRGVGVYHFLELIEARLDTALNAAGATVDLQSNAEFIRVCLQNTRQRADQIIELEQALLAADSVEAMSEETQQSTELAGQLQEGFDLNEDGTVDPFEGECGLNQIEFYGLQLARLTLNEGPLGDAS